MPTAFISHAACFAHDPGPEHPENAARLSAIQDRLVASGLLEVLQYHEAPEVSRAQLRRVHGKAYLEWLERMAPASGYVRLDPDTIICPESLPAARRAAGAAVLAADLVLAGQVHNAFCSVRPPGHHAERERAMGFCLYNNIAVGVAHALEQHGVERVAVVDFDVHQGNGTEMMFADEQRVLFCSTFQHPFYPFTPLLPDTPNRVSSPLPAGSDGKAFRTAVAERWLPALQRFRPQIVFVSAGFDGHRDDDMSHLCLEDADYRWVTEQVMELAAEHASGRVVSLLEGGYELNSLARCMEAHIRLLMGLG